MTEKQTEKNNKMYSKRWEDTVHAMQAPILQALLTVSVTSARNPKRTIVAVVTLSLALILVGLATNFRVVVDSERLWTPQNSKSIQHMEWLNDKSGFPKNPRRFFLFFHQNGGNVLGKDQVRRVFLALNTVRNLSGYDEMCADSPYENGTCAIHGIVDFFNESVAVFEQRISTDEEAIAAVSGETYPSGRPVSRGDIMGFPVTDADNTLVSVKSFTILIEFPETGKAEKFEERALDAILYLDEVWQKDPSTSLRVEVQADRSIEDEFNCSIIVDIPLIPLVFITMAIFTCLVFAKWNKVHSQSLLGFAAVISVLLSLMSGYGFMFMCGVPLTSMAQILPFVIFGVGLDDSFVISGAYVRTDKKVDPVERVRVTIQECGMSITLTTLTSTLAFGLGCISTIPAVFWLCMYAYTTIFWVYVYQLTFFIACSVLDEKRIIDRRRDCCICWTAREEEELTGQNQETDSFADRVMVWYAEKLLRPNVKLSVLVSFTILAVMSAHSVTKLEQSFEYQSVLPSDSYLVDYLDVFEEYAQSVGLSPFVVFRHVDQSDPIIQDQMDQYVKDLVSIDTVADGPEFFWLRDFWNFSSHGALTDLHFNDQIVYFWKILIVLDTEGNVIASRCVIKLENMDINNVKDQIGVLADQRKVTEAQSINVGKNNWRFFAYEHIYNIWEFYSVCARELALTTIIGVSAVVFVAAALIPHWTAAFFILPMICVLYINVLGFLQWCGLSINPVTYVTSVMSIGLLVDFIMHILLRYYDCRGSRRERTMETLRTMGSSVLTGAISTFLGTLPLALSSSAIFSTVFIAFIGLVLFGATNGLVVLPILLSILGPEDPEDQEEETSHGS